jgi:hypothetical protein
VIKPFVDLAENNKFGDVKAGKMTRENILKYFNDNPDLEAERKKFRDNFLLLSSIETKGKNPAELSKDFEARLKDPKKDELIKSEITKLISINNPKLTNKGGMKYKNPLSLDIDTQSLSYILKDFNQERNFRELFNYIEANKNPVLAGGSNLKFYKKYLKYKNKYMILKNKQI